MSFSAVKWELCSCSYTFGTGTVEKRIEKNAEKREILRMNNA